MQTSPQIHANAVFQAHTAIGKVKATTKEDYERVIKAAQEAYKDWKIVPAPNS